MSGSSDAAARARSVDRNGKGPLAVFRLGWRILSVVAIALTFTIWFTITKDGLALVRPIIFPSPAMVIDAALRLNDIIVFDVVVTFARVVAGFCAGTALGVGLGLAMSYNEKILYFFDPIVESMRPVPVIAMIPFFLMWFGIDEVGKFLLITLGVFAILVVSTVEAVRNVPRKYTLAAQTLGASKAQWFRTIVVPAVIPELIGPLRVASALSFTLVVAAEFMGAQAGIGYRILEARRMFNTDVILLGVVVIGMMSAVTDTLIRRLTAHITRWSERSKKR